MFKDLFLDNWKGKAISLIISFGIWYLIKSNLGEEKPRFPVPGTGTASSPRPTATSSPLDETILSPLAPPIPGSKESPK